VRPVIKLYEKRKGLLDWLAYGLAIYCVFAWYQQRDCPYTLTQDSGIQYVVKKETRQKKQLTQDFELGTLEQRLRGILKEGKENVRTALEQLSQNYRLE